MPNKLPATVEEWTAPWEEEGAELDPAVLKKLVFNLKKSEIDLEAKVTELNTAVETFKEADKASKDALEKALEGATGKLKEQLEEAKAAAAAADKKALRLELGLDEDTFNLLKGDTVDELRAAGEKLKAKLGTTETEVEETDEQKAEREKKEAEEREKKEAEAYLRGTTRVYNPGDVDTEQINTSSGATQAELEAYWARRSMA